MASMILGGIGSMLGGPIGGALGSAIGGVLDNMLFNHNKIRKPSLQDLVVEASTFGLPIPKNYGRNKIAGNMIMSIPLVAEPHSGKGMSSGKGTKYYTYNCTFSVAYCTGPIANFWRIFTDSKVVWDMNPLVVTGPNTSVPNSPIPTSGLSNVSDWGAIATLYHYGTGKNSNVQQAGATVSFYFGTEDQPVDGFFDTWIGTFGLGPLNPLVPPGPGYVPAYRGTCYMTFNGLPLQDYGNRIPNIAAEVNGYYDGPATMISTSSFTDPSDAMGGPGQDSYPDFLSNIMISWTLQSVTYDSLTISVLSAYNIQSGAPLSVIDFTNNSYVVTFTGGHFANLDGTAFVLASKDVNGAYWVCGGSLASGPCAFAFQPYGGIISSGFHLNQPGFGAGFIGPGLVFNYSDDSNLQLVIESDGGAGGTYANGVQVALFLIGSTNIRVQASSTSLITGITTPGTLEITVTGSILGWGGGGQFVSGQNVNGEAYFVDAFYYSMIVFDSTGFPKTMIDLSTAFTGQGSQSLEFGYDASNGFAIFFNLTDMWACSDVSDPGGSIVAHITAASLTGNPSSQFTGSSTSLVSMQIMQGTVAVATDDSLLWLLNDTNLTPTGQQGFPLNFTTADGGIDTPFWYNPMGGGGIDFKPLDPVGSGNSDLYIFRYVGGPITLASIVEDICEECGLAPDQIDTSASTDYVYGYVISQEMSGRAAMEPLQQVFLFDLVESDYVLKFVYRTNPTSILTVDESDLAARSKSEGFGDEAALPRYTETRQQDLDLPQVVSLRYHTTQGDFYVRDFSYAIASQYAKRARATTGTITRLSISVAIVLDDGEAANLCQKMIALQYIQRTAYEFSLPLKYVKIEPGDVITLSLDGGAEVVPVYIEQIDFGADNTLKIQAKVANAEVYNGFAIPPSPPFGVLNPMQPGSPGLLELLDLPPLRDTDNDLGIYYGAAPVAGAIAGWGAAVVESPDNGLTYNPVGTITVSAVIGYAANALGTTLAIAGLWDLINELTVQFLGAVGSSVSPLTVYTGSNIFLVGKEIIAAMNVQSNGNGTWNLSGLLRGMQGTDIYIDTHVLGEIVVQLQNDGSINDYIPPASDLNVSRLYRIINPNADPSSSPFQNFVLKGVRITPEAPVSIGVQFDSSGDATIGWWPRRRTNYEWQDGPEVWVDESPEVYTLDLYDSSFTILNREIIITSYTSPYPSYEYLAADIATDGLVGSGETWNPNDAGTRMTISGGDLTARNHTSGGPAGVRALVGASTGKFYFEVTPSQLVNNNTGIGLCDSGVDMNALTGGNSVIYTALAYLFDNQVFEIAVDVGAKLVWGRTIGHQWNNSGTANPATSTGGISISAFSGLVYPCFFSDDTSGFGEQAVANFGATAFADTPPAGFSAGYPGPNNPQINAIVYQMSTAIGRGFGRRISS